MDLQMFTRCNIFLILANLCLLPQPSWQKMDFLDLSKYGKMLPNDPLFETGKELVVNCTLLSNYTGDSTAADIYFKFDNVTYRGKPHVTEMTSRTAEFRLPNMTRSLTGKHVLCYVPDVTHWIGQQVITVADLPEQPRLIECRVKDWRNMTCRWEPKEQNTGIPTDQKLYWTIFYSPNPRDWRLCPRLISPMECLWLHVDDRDSWQIDRTYFMCVQSHTSRVEPWCPRSNSIKFQTRFADENQMIGEKEQFYCPNPERNACHWKEAKLSQKDESQGDSDQRHNDAFKHFKTYHVGVVANNSLGLRATAVQSINTVFQELISVEPRKVDVLNMVNSTSSSLTLRWSSHYDRLRTLLYEVSWRSYDKQNKTWREPQARNTSVHNMTVEGLSAATRHKIWLRCIPLFSNKGHGITNCEGPFTECSARGFWSEFKKETFITEEDVPAAAPQTVPGGFAWHGDKRVLLFWQSVPDYLSNGNITHYYVNHTLLGAEDIKKNPRPVSGSFFQVDFKLQDGHVYKFIVDAKTKQGFNTSLQHKPIIISTMKEHALDKTPEIFSAIVKEHGVMINWTLVEGAVGYTVFWCKGKTINVACDEELKWIELGINQTDTAIALNPEESYGYKIGLAIQYEATFPGKKSSSRARLRRSAPENLLLSSGIQWTDCIHDDKGAVRPQNFDLGDHQKAETLAVKWEAPECHKTGYILYYILHYCLQNECEEPGRIKVHNKKTSYVITDLEADKEYTVWMTSMSASHEESEETEKLSMSVGRSGLHPKYIAIIVVILLLLTVLALVGVHHFCRKTKKKVTKYKTTQPTLPARNFSIDYCDDGLEGLVEGGLTTSGGTAQEQQNRDNEALYQERKAVTGGPILNTADEEGNKLSNGGVGINAGRVRFEKKLSSHGSVSSQETLTTPLPSLDLPRDDAEFFRSDHRNRNMSGGSNLDTVPESPRARKKKGGARSYYNVSESSSIESYNKVGFLDEDPHVTGRSPNSESKPGSLPPENGAQSQSSPETSPLRSPTAPTSGQASPAGRGSTSPTHDGANPYDVPSEISSYSKIDCRDLAPSEYDSSAGSHFSADTVIDTFRSKAPVSPLTAAPPAFPDTATTAAALPPNTDDYVDQGFMETMASNASLHGSDASDIASYSVVGERSDTSDDSNSKDTYLDYNENEDADSNESEPLVLSFDWTQKQPRSNEPHPTIDPGGQRSLTDVPTTTCSTDPTQSTAFKNNKNGQQPLTNGLDGPHDSCVSDSDVGTMKDGSFHNGSGDQEGNTNIQPSGTVNGPMSTKTPLTEVGSTGVYKDKNSNTSAFPNAKHSTKENPPMTNGSLTPPPSTGFSKGRSGAEVKPLKVTEGGYVTLDSLTSSGISASPEGETFSDEGGSEMEDSSTNVSPVSPQDVDSSNGYVAHDMLTPSWNKVSV